MQRLTHPQAIFTSFKLEKSCAVAPESVAATDPLRTISPSSVAAEESMAVASCSASYSSSASDIDDTDDGQQRKHNNNNNNKVDDRGHEAEVINRTAAVLNLPQNHINDANKVLSKYPESFINPFNFPNYPNSL